MRAYCRLGIVLSLSLCSCQGHGGIGEDVVMYQGFEVRYQDIAYDAVNNRVGMTFYDPVSGMVLIRELSRGEGVGTVTDLDYGAEGDTSLVYDADGNAHVAYYGIDDDGDALPDRQEQRGAWLDSHAPLAASGKPAIFYRRRVDGVWQHQEIVDQAGTVNREEHTIDIDGSGQPFCVISTSVSNALIPAGELGVPALVKRTGKNHWEKNILPVSQGLTSQNLDSASVNSDGTTTTYVVVWDQQESSLQLAVDQDASWQLYPLVAERVLGYQSVALLPDGTLGITYMGSPDNRLMYGVWSASTGYTGKCASGEPETGFQSEIALDNWGRPLILSIWQPAGELLVATPVETEGVTALSESSGTVVYASDEGGLDLLRCNTLDAVCLGDESAAVYFLPSGGVGYSTFIAKH